MEKSRTDRNDAGERDGSRHDAAPAQAAVKKVYQKPVLSKHEQLHGIGLGTA